jgi:hypothetical protein
MLIVMSLLGHVIDGKECLEESPTIRIMVESKKELLQQLKTFSRQFQLTIHKKNHIMAAYLRLQPRRKPFPQTGSPFDASNTAQIKPRPGVQDTMPIDVDVGAL